MGEGYIQPRRGMEFENVGVQLFDDLVARSFFSRLSNDDYTKYNMHDLLHNLAKFVSKDDCLRIEAGEPIEAPMDTARHFSFIRGQKKIEQIKLDDLYGCKSLRKIRTLIFTTGLVQLGDLIDKFSCLRVLSLSFNQIKDVPYSIGNLIHLRYLDLSYNPIESLPNSICSLYNLQTLILDNCDNLIKLPNATMDLINLRHLLLYGCCKLTSSPPKMGKLTRLRNLSKFIVGGDGSECTILELKHLVNLGGEIEISSLENVANREKAEEADLKNRKNLERLILKWGDDREIFDKGGQEEEVLEGLQPHINLKELTIDGYMGASLPSWLLQQNQLITFINLVSITFSKCKKCQLLPPLWKLPSLKYLNLAKMEGLERLEHQFCGVQGFPLLEKLLLLDLVNLEEWWGEEGGGDYMPSLRTLKVTGCPKLKIFPLHLSPALLELTIEGCIELVVDLLRFPSLKYLDVLHSNVSLLKSVPYLTSLKKLIICKDDEVESLDIQNLHSLYELTFKGCSKLSSFYPPANLRWLNINKCPNLEALPLDLHNLSSLKILSLKGCPKVTSLPENGLPASLTYLGVEDFPNLEALPLDLHNLSSLNYLSLDNCPKVTSLPEKGLPASLTMLTVEGCPLLIERCEKEKGEDWHKISHIPTCWVE